MACARCGCGIHQTEDLITMNKIWHKCCFTCYKCKCNLDKCAAKIYQGEVFCANCYNSILEELEEVIPSPSPSRPCRVLSSPSCTCEQVDQKNCQPRCQPNFDYCKKYEVCFAPEENVKCAKNCQSCSCIPDTNRDICCRKDPYCFAFPLPREVANYYNREHMKPRKYTSPPNCCPNQPCRSKKDPQVCIKIRSLSPNTPCCRSPNRCRRSPDREKCCCSKCCPPPRRKPCSCCPRPTCRSPKRCTPARRKLCTQCSRFPPPCAPSPPCPPCTPATFCPRRRSPCSSCRSPCNKSRSPCPPRSCATICPPIGCTRDAAEYSCSACPADNEPKCREPKCCSCSCGKPIPRTCDICQVRAVCTAICVRCGHKVYAAERVLVTNGAYHTCCFSCYCCHKLLDVKNVFENCGEIYCKQCYNNFFGTQYYGYGSSQIC